MGEQQEGKPVKHIAGWDIMEGNHEDATLWIAQKKDEIEIKGRAGPVLKITEAVVSSAHNYLGAYSYMSTADCETQLGENLGQPDLIPIQVIAELIEIKLKRRNQTGIRIASVDEIKRLENGEGQFPK